MPIQFDVDYRVFIDLDMIYTGKQTYIYLIIYWFTNAVQMKVTSVFNTLMLKISRN